jgi:hypothetical protein
MVNGSRPGRVIGESGEVPSELTRAELEEAVDVAAAELRNVLEWLLEVVIPEDDPRWMPVSRYQ